jgi:hemoglobin
MVVVILFVIKIKMQIKKDIESRDDLLLLMQQFYKKLLADVSISYLFTNVAKVNLDHHFPILVDFWDSILFQSATYQKNAMQPHMILHQKSPLQKHHFETWLRYFKETVDELFNGTNAFIIKEKATSIATVMEIKISRLS